MKNISIFCILIICICFGPTKAQEFERNLNGSNSSIDSYAWDRVVFVQMSCIPTYSPPPADPALLPPNVERNSVASGFFISSAGHIVTAHHLLDEAYRVQEISAEGLAINYEESCKPENVKINIYYDSRSALLGGSPDFIDISRSRVAKFSESDVLLVQADLNNGRPITTNYLCPSLVPGGLKKDDTVIATGFGISRGRSFGYQEQLNVIGAGVGQAANYFQLSEAIPNGSSGGPVISNDGLVVGMIHGRTRIQGENPDSVKGLIVPLKLFNEVFEDYGTNCKGDEDYDLEGVPGGPENQNYDDLRVVINGAVIANSETKIPQDTTSPAHSFSNSSSCTEGWRQTSYPLCLPTGSTITQVKGPFVQSAHNDGRSWYEEDPARPNCVILNYGYSDRGRSWVGECKGNGWITASWSINGYSIITRRSSEPFSKELAVDPSKNESYIFSPTIELPQNIISTKWSYSADIRMFNGDILIQQFQLTNDPELRETSSEQLGFVRAIQSNISGAVRIDIESDL